MTSDVVGFFGATPSYLLAIGLGWVVFPGFVAAAIGLAVLHVRTWLRLRQAEAVGFSGRPGPALVVGRVRPLDRDSAPVEVSVTQVGKEREGHEGPKTRWTEVARELRSEPFDLELEDGRSVRVEPDAKTKLFGAIDAVDMIGAARRVRRARLRAGDHVFAKGAMRPRTKVAAPDSAYRGTVAAKADGARPLALRGSQLAPLVLSTRALTAGRAGRVVYHACAAVWLLAALLALHLKVLEEMDASLLTGRVVRATGEAREQWPELVRARSKTHLRMHHSVTFSYEAAPGRRERVSLPVSASVFAACHEGAACTYSLRVSDGARPTVFAGRHPRLRTGAFVYLLIGAALCAAYVSGAVLLTPWYERRRLDETTPGPLPVPPTAPVA